MSIKFGPVGIGGVNDAVSNLEKYHKLGLTACEIAFTYGVYIKRKEDAIKIKNAAKKFKITLSIHAPYWINLNSSDKEKVEKSKQRILKCCEIGTYLEATKIVFHPGYYTKIDKENFAKPKFSKKNFEGAKSCLSSDCKFRETINSKFSKEKTYENIKREILEIQKEIKRKKYTPKLAPETTGKVNVFGSIDEIFNLSKDTKCSFCIDFAHILAKYKEYKFKEVLDKFKKHKDIHIHFSGIIYGEKGERAHKKTPEEDLKKLILSLPENKKVTIINESPNTLDDSILGLKIYSKK